MSLYSVWRTLEGITRIPNLTELALNAKVRELPESIKNSIHKQLWHVMGRPYNIPFYGKIAFEESFELQRISFHEKAGAVGRHIQDRIGHLSSLLSNPDNMNSLTILIVIVKSFDHGKWPDEFGQLPQDEKDRIYHWLWVLKNLDNVEKAGEKAFHDQAGMSSTMDEKKKAVECFICEKASLPPFHLLRMAFEQKNLYWAQYLESLLSTEDKNSLYESVYCNWKEKTNQEDEWRIGEYLFTRLPVDYAPSLEQKRLALSQATDVAQQSFLNFAARTCSKVNGLTKSNITHIETNRSEMMDRARQSKPKFTLQPYGSVNVYFLHGRGVFIVIKALTPGGFKEPLSVIDYDQEKERVLLKPRPGLSLEKEIENIRKIGKHSRLAKCIWEDVDLDMILQTKYESSLSNLLHEYYPNLKEKDKWAICADSIRGLNYLHKKKLVHRDIKGGNILVKRVDDVWRAFITDFGSVIEQSKAKTTPFEGTLIFLPPEVLKHLIDRRKFPNCQGRRADIFSMGVVWYQVWHKQLPRWCTEVIAVISRNDPYEKLLATPGWFEYFKEAVLGQPVPEQRIQGIGFESEITNRQPIDKLISQMLLAKVENRPFATIIKKELLDLHQ